MSLHKPSGVLSAPFHFTEIQKAAIAGVASFCLSLRKRLQGIRTSLATDSSKPQRFLLVEQALVVARFARGLLLTSISLRDSLSTTDLSGIAVELPQRASLGSLSSNFSAEVMRELNAVYLDGFLLWVDCTAAYLQDSLASQLNSHFAVASNLLSLVDPSPVDRGIFAASRVRTTWQEVKVGADLVEDLVPHQPSPFIVAFLFSIVQEIQRVGSHCVDREVVECLVFSLSDRLVGVFDAFVLAHSSGSPMPKEISIQLWFDAKFCFGACSRLSFTDSYRLIYSLRCFELSDGVLLLYEAANVGCAVWLGRLSVGG